MVETLCYNLCLIHIVKCSYLQCLVKFMLYDYTSFSANQLVTRETIHRERCDFLHIDCSMNSFCLKADALGSSIQLGGVKTCCNWVYELCYFVALQVIYILFFFSLCSPNLYIGPTHPRTKHKARYPDEQQVSGYHILQMADIVGMT